MSSLSGSSRSSTRQVLSGNSVNMVEHCIVGSSRQHVRSNHAVDSTVVKMDLIHILPVILSRRSMSTQALAGLWDSSCEHEVPVLMELIERNSRT